MTHTEAFAAMQARKRAEEARTIRVSWRKVDHFTGGGYNGLGPGGLRVHVTPRKGGGYTYGRMNGPERLHEGQARLLADAKLAAEALYRLPLRGRGVRPTD